MTTINERYDYLTQPPRVTEALIEASIRWEFFFTPADALRFQWITDDPDDPRVRAAKDSVIARLQTRSYSGACQDIDANIQDTLKPVSLLTFCVLVLNNGFTVTGQSACVSPETFDAEIGRKVAREDAIRQVWPLLGYQLKTDLAVAEFHQKYGGTERQA